MMQIDYERNGIMVVFDNGPGSAHRAIGPFRCVEITETVIAGFDRLTVVSIAIKRQGHWEVCDGFDDGATYTGLRVLTVEPDTTPRQIEELFPARPQSPERRHAA
jgi:hypothetical protein